MTCGLGQLFTTGSFFSGGDEIPDNHCQVLRVNKNVTQEY